MKKRTFSLLTFLALNVLFFAVYLNFIHKDTNVLPAVSASSNQAARQLTTEPAKQPVAANLLQKGKMVSLAN
jgi:hypothetical protein